MDDVVVSTTTTATVPTNDAAATIDLHCSSISEGGGEGGASSSSELRQENSCAKCIKLQAKYTKLTGIRFKIQNCLIDTNNANAKLEDEANGLGKKVKGLEEKVKGLEEELTNTKESLDQTKESLTQKVLEMNALGVQHTSEMQRLRRELADTQKNRDDFKKKCSVLEEKNKSRGSLEKELEELNNHIHNNVILLESEKRQSIQLKEELAMKDAVIANRDETIERQALQIIELKSVMAHMSLQITELQQQQQQMSNGYDHFDDDDNDNDIHNIHDGDGGDDDIGGVNEGVNSNQRTILARISGESADQYVDRVLEACSGVHEAAVWIHERCAADECKFVVKSLVSALFRLKVENIVAICTKLMKMSGNKWSKMGDLFLRFCSCGIFGNPSASDEEWAKRSVTLSQGYVLLCKNMKWESEARILVYELIRELDFVDPMILSAACSAWNAILEPSSTDQPSILLEAILCVLQDVAKDDSILDEDKSCLLQVLSQITYTSSETPDSLVNTAFDRIHDNPKKCFEEEKAIELLGSFLGRTFAKIVVDHRIIPQLNRDIGNVETAALNSVYYRLLGYFSRTIKDATMAKSVLDHSKSIITRNYPSALQDAAVLTLTELTKVFPDLYEEVSRCIESLPSSNKQRLIRKYQPQDATKSKKQRR